MGKKSISTETRWQIIGLYKSGTLSNIKIGEITNVSEKCVRTTIKNYENFGTANETPRSGRPEKFSDQDKRSIIMMSRKNPTLSLRNLATEFNNIQNNHSVSKDTIRRILHRRGIDSYVAQRKPLLRVTDRMKRKKWCKERLKWGVDEWSRVIFSDESNFQVFNRKSKVFVKRLKSEKYDSRMCVPRIQAGGGSVGIWGCISHKGTGCISTYEGTMNQYNYKETLEKYLKPSISKFYGRSRNFFFQQDGAPCHTANSMKDYFENKHIRLLPWCARSPDLSPIENIWSWMDRKMLDVKITSKEHLKHVLTSTWQSIPKELCMKLVESMPRRVKMCFKANGGYFKY